MKAIARLLSRFQPKTFRINYTPEYKTFFQPHAASDPLHPLHILRVREIKERKREGLWWHVTSGAESSKSSVVRSWCRRRLRNAFIEVLKDRGFDEFGRRVDAVALTDQHKASGHILECKQASSLTGSVRLHVKPTLVAAKYADVREEAAAVVDILVEGIKTNSSHDSIPVSQMTLSPPGSRSQSNSRSPLDSQPHWKSRAQRSSQRSKTLTSARVVPSARQSPKTRTIRKV